jgi:hypothetical protein
MRRRHQAVEHAPSSMVFVAVTDDANGISLQRPLPDPPRDECERDLDPIRSWPSLNYIGEVTFAISFNVRMPLRDSQPQILFPDLTWSKPRKWTHYFC